MGERATGRDVGADLDAVFAAGGALAGVLPGFAPRAEQLAMAAAVAEAVAGRRALLVEAGTGTGKTLAYLVPLLLAGRRALVATGTRTLQDQLFHRDLPMLGGALGRPATIRLLKGRANYLCRQRLDRLLEGGSEALFPAERADLDRVRQWARATRGGDLAELEGLAETSAVRRLVTSTAENCLGSRCPRFDGCHVAAARQAAREADIVIINHHLLMADLTLQDTGFGELLPEVDAVVVDEAHRFPEVAHGFFHQSVSATAVGELAADIRTEARIGGALPATLARTLEAIDAALERASAALPRDDSNRTWPDAGPRFVEAFEELGETVGELAEALPGVSEEEPVLARCAARAAGLAARIAEVAAAQDGAALRWARRTPRGFVATLAPLDVSAPLGGLLAGRDCAWIFTSATLAVGEDFGHFAARLGIDRATTRRFESPFDFARNARLYLPDGLPAPADPGYTDAVVAAVRPILDASRGRAFLLFTSHRALRRAAALLRADPDFDFPLLVQGESSRSRLLEAFADLDAAVLLGTATFWEGVDIRGPKLVLVMIDRLPFASPGDPLLAARLEAIREAGGNPFRDHQLPHAVLGLKQGFGRLVRDHADYGVVMLCDPRLRSRSYGRVFLDSLPRMPVLHDPAAVARFFAERAAPAEACPS